MDTLVAAVLDAWKKEDRMCELMPAASFVLSDHVSGGDMGVMKFIRIGYFKQGKDCIVYMLSTDNPNETVTCIRSTGVSDVADRVIVALSMMCGQSKPHHTLVALTYSTRAAGNVAPGAIEMGLFGYYKQPLSAPSGNQLAE